MKNDSSFFSFFKKPVMCKCGHPNKPCHRSGKWYDPSRSCKECDCDYFVLRNESSKLNRALDIGAISGLGFVAVIVFAFGILGYNILDTNKDLGSQTIVVHTSTILNYMSLGSILFGAWLSGTIFDFICKYMRVHRKQVLPIDEKWSNEE